MFVKSQMFVHSYVIKYRMIDDDFSSIKNRSWVDKCDDDETAMMRFDNDDELIAYVNVKTFDEYFAFERDAFGLEPDFHQFVFIHDETI